MRDPDEREKLLLEDRGMAGNPFSYESPVTYFEGSKMLLMCATGVPLWRGLLIAPAVACMLGVSFVATLGMDQNADLPEPMSWWRRFLIWPMRYAVRYCLFVIGFYWIEVRGDAWAGEAKTVPFIVSNHVSLTDILVLWYLRMPSAVGKAELWGNPVLRRLCRAIQAIPVDRKSAEGRQRCKELIQHQTSDSRFPPLLIFPQGTCTRQSFVTMFKNGAFVAGKPVLPIAIRYPFRNFDPCETCSSTSDWTGLRMLCQVYQRCQVNILPVYKPNESEIADPNLYARNVRNVIARTIGAATTMHEYKDMLLYEAASHKKHAVDLGAFTLVSDEGSDGVELSLDQARLVLDKFRKIDLDKNGRITPDEFCIAFNLQLGSEHAQRLFDFFDRNHDGEIEFNELAAGMLVCVSHERDRVLGHDVGDEQGSRGASWEQLCRFAFDVLDVDGDGLVPRAELRDLLVKANSGLDSAPSTPTFDHRLETALGPAAQRGEAGVESPKSRGGGKADPVTFAQFKEMVGQERARIVKAATRSIDERFADTTNEEFPTFFPFHRMASQLRLETEEEGPAVKKAA